MVPTSEVVKDIVKQRNRSISNLVLYFEKQRNIESDIVKQRNRRQKILKIYFYFQYNHNNSIQTNLRKYAIIKIQSKQIYKNMWSKSKMGRN
jgi:5'-deoxynucleotidase YfbR-like HD superfamily hydrolase